VKSVCGDRDSSVLARIEAIEPVTESNSDSKVDLSILCFVRAETLTLFHRWNVVAER
jgi:hypothetical protein